MIGKDFLIIQDYFLFEHKVIEMPCMAVFFKKWLQRFHNGCTKVLIKKERELYQTDWRMYCSFCYEAVLCRFCFYLLEYGFNETANILLNSINNASK